jgi:hypothetical protein
MSAEISVCRTTIKMKELILRLDRRMAEALYVHTLNIWEKKRCPFFFLSVCCDKHVKHISPLPQFDTLQGGPSVALQRRQTAFES